MDTVASVRINRSKYAFIAWIIFSLFFWFAAYSRPFHVDEFYSWVYAERCTYVDLFLFKDSGIGHPPLYHLLQKIAQDILPFFHPVCVRLVNYIIGSIFSLKFTLTFLNFRCSPLFCYSVCSSATVLNAFIFSRMWGLVLLSSLLLLEAGERYVAGPSWKNLASIMLICALGFLSDYNFILILPYLAGVIFYRQRSYRLLSQLALPILIILWAVLTYVASKENFKILYFLPDDLTKLGVSLSITLLGFHYLELLIAALGVIFTALTVEYYLISRKGSDYIALKILIHIVAILFYLTILHYIALYLDLYKLLRWRYIMLLSIFPFLILMKKQILYLYFKLEGRSCYILVSIILSLLILIIIDRLFYRRLIDPRFTLVLFPFIIYLVSSHATNITKMMISLILAVSGVLYTASNFVDGYYPPLAFTTNEFIFYTNEAAYATQFFYNKTNSEEQPIFVGKTLFSKFCRVCDMGSALDSLDAFENVLIVKMGEDEDASDFDCLTNNGFTLQSRTPLLGKTDTFLIRHLTPIRGRWNRWSYLYLYTKEPDG